MKAIDNRKQQRTETTLRRGKYEFTREFIAFKNIKTLKTNKYWRNGTVLLFKLL